MNDRPWRDMHDATVSSIQLDWPLGEVRIHVDLVGPTEGIPAEIFARGVTMLRCPRELPWGESVSINSVTVRAPSEGTSVAEIEMQTGDVLALRAREITLLRAAP